jgi:hypothetical protein
VITPPDNAAAQSMNLLLLDGANEVTRTAYEVTRTAYKVTTAPNHALELTAEDPI